MTGPDSTVLRAGILELLELLADAAAQERYEHNVPIADVPAELCCMWFDDLYHPDSPAFQAAFTVAELDALASSQRPNASVTALRSERRGSPEKNVVTKMPVTGPDQRNGRGSTAGELPRTALTSFALPEIGRAHV